MERETVMNEKMKLLIAYDGSAHAQAALNDLRRAGLPRETEALVVSIAGGLSTSPSSASEIVAQVATSRRVSSAIDLARSQEMLSLKEAEELALEAGRQIRTQFPHWEIRAEGLLGTPAAEIIRKAEEWRADLIMVGSHGRSALGRFILGSVSQQLATEAPCSVRVARCPVEKDDSPIRLIIGVDGSPSARMAVSAMARRRWPAGSEARVIAVDDHVRPTGIAHILPTATAMIAEKIEEELAKKQEMVEAALEDLRAVAGLHVSPAIIQGDPKSVLIEVAKRFQADCIVVGSRGFNSRLERFMLGSVSTAVVNGAHCSVEVVRMREPP